MASSGKRVATPLEPGRAHNALDQKRARKSQAPENTSIFPEINVLVSGQPLPDADDLFELSHEFPKLPQADRLMWELASSGVETVSLPGTLPRGFSRKVVAESRVLYNVGGALMNNMLLYSTSQMQGSDDNFERRPILQEQYAYMSTQTVDFIPACDPMDKRIAPILSPISKFLDVVSFEIQMACQSGHKTRLEAIESQDTHSRRHIPPPEARKGVVWLLLPTANAAKSYTSDSAVNYLDAFAYLASTKSSAGTRLSQQFRFAVACNGDSIDGNPVQDANEVMKFFNLTPFPASDRTLAALLVVTMGPNGKAVHQIVDLSKHIGETTLNRSIGRSEAWETPVGRYVHTLTSTLTFILEAVGLHDHAGAVIASFDGREPYKNAFLIEQSMASRRFYDMLDMKSIDLMGDEHDLHYLRNSMQPPLSEELFAKRKEEALEEKRRLHSQTQQLADEDDFKDEDEEPSDPLTTEEPTVSPYADNLVCAGFMRMTERGTLLLEALKHTNGVREEQIDFINQETLIRDNVRAKLNRFNDEDENALEHYATRAPGLYEAMPVQVWCDPEAKETVSRLLCNNWCLDYRDNEMITYFQSKRVVFCFLWSTYVNMRSQLGYYSIQSCIKDAQPRPCEGLHMLQFKLAAPSGALFRQYCMQPCSIECLFPDNFYNVQAAQQRMLQFENLLRNLGDPQVCLVWKYLKQRHALPEAWEPPSPPPPVEEDVPTDEPFQLDEYGGGFEGGDIPYGFGSSTESPIGTSTSISRPTHMSKCEIRDAANELLKPNQCDSLKPLAKLVSLMVRRFGPLADMEAAVGQLVEEINNNRVVLAKESEAYKNGNLKPLEAYSRLLG